MVYVMSDIHGHAIRFKIIMSRINLQPNDHLYILGDVIDRWPHGINILQELMQIPNCTVLLGNHEYMFLDAISDKWSLSDWFANGGRVTYESFCSLSCIQQDEIISFIKNMPINTEIRVNDKNFLLAHGNSPALYRPRYKEYANETEFVVWDRVTADAKLPQGQILVFGHTPTCYYQDSLPMSIRHGKNRIGIDCGAGSTSGRLACLRLDDMKEFYSE